jgi:hypothetical protein
MESLDALASRVRCADIVDALGDSTNIVVISCTWCSPAPQRSRPTTCALRCTANRIVAADAASVVTIRGESPNTLGDGEN